MAEDITVEVVDSHDVSNQENISVRSRGSAVPCVPSVPDSASNNRSPLYLVYSYLALPVGLLCFKNN